MNVGVWQFQNPRRNEYHRCKLLSFPIHFIDYLIQKGSLFSYYLQIRLFCCNVRESVEATEKELDRRGAACGHALKSNARCRIRKSNGA